MKKSEIAYFAILVVSMIYLSNITAGIIEFIPDNIPIVGNADEGIAGALVYWAIQKLTS